jgi:DNA polymerase (family 10)
MKHFKNEEDLYDFLGLSFVPPELREDRGEVEAALINKLPSLLMPTDIQGDLHVHSSYDLSSSHDLGANSIAENFDTALSLGYAYMGFSDHNPSVGTHNASQITHIMEKRMETYKKEYGTWKSHTLKSHPNIALPELFVMCEVDIAPNGELALPKEAFEFVDAVVVSIHSSFTQPSEEMTARVLKALQTDPKVRIFGHPTGRLLGKRESASFKWSEIYAVCKERDIALEINANPSRLDVSDSVVFEARQKGIRFCIDTDAHAIDQLLLMPYGVDVARRGWATKHDIVNTLGYTGFSKWLRRT